MSITKENSRFRLKIYTTPKYLATMISNISQDFTRFKISQDSRFPKIQDFQRISKISQDLKIIEDSKNHLTLDTKRYPFDNFIKIKEEFHDFPRFKISQDFKDF